MTETIIAFQIISFPSLSCPC